MIKIDINLVFTIINLLVLYLLMKKFLFGPIIKVMDVRKAMIDQQFAGAKEQEDQAKALKEQYEGALKSAREESFQIMDAKPSGESMEYTEFSYNITEFPTPKANAPPLPPSPVTIEITGTFKSNIFIIDWEMASPCPRSSAPNPG